MYAYSFPKGPNPKVKMILPSGGASSPASRYALVADDETAVRKLIVRALQIIGFDVLEAENGKQALELSRQNQVDLVVTDCQMPVMDGFTLIKKLKSELPQTPVILVSGQNLGGPEMSEIGGRHAVQDVLHKPFPLLALHRAALRAVGRGSSAEGPFREERMKTV